MLVPYIQQRLKSSPSKVRIIKFIWPIISVLVCNAANAMKTYGIAEADLQACLTSTLGKWSVSGPVALPTGKERPVSQWTGGWVGPTPSLNTAPKKKKTQFLPEF
jgi:hypothetical protein